MKSTACYMRVSTRTQSVQAQKSAILKWMESEKIDPKDASWIHDDGISGATMERPEFKKLDAAVEDGKVKTIVMFALDRLARNALEGQNVLHKWLQSGVHLVIVTLAVDLKGTMGQMVASLFFHIAQLEREHMLERQRAGIDVAREKHARAWQLSDRGKNPSEIAAEIGTPLKTVRKMLQSREMLWWVNKDGRKKVPVNMSEVGAMLRQGMAINEIARAKNLAVRTLHRRIAAAGGVKRILSEKGS